MTEEEYKWDFVYTKNSPYLLTGQDLTLQKFEATITSMAVQGIEA